MLGALPAPPRTLGSRAWGLYTRVRARWWSLTDPRLQVESRERIVFHHLVRAGRLDRFRGGRILEIGPKHGEDSRLLASLEPRDLVLLDLPEKDALVESWISELDARYVSGNLLYLTPAELAGLGTFDLVWCLGVLYHNAEQLRRLRRPVRSSTTRQRNASSGESGCSRRSNAVSGAQAQSGISGCREKPPDSG